MGRDLQSARHDITYVILLKYKKSPGQVLLKYKKSPGQVLLKYKKSPGQVLLKYKKSQAWSGVTKIQEESGLVRCY